LHPLFQVQHPLSITRQVPCLYRQAREVLSQFLLGRKAQPNVDGQTQFPKQAVCRIAVLIGLAVLASGRRQAVLAGGVSGGTAEPDWPALLEEAQHQFGTGNYLDAIVTLRSVISQNPLSAEGFYWAGRCYYEIRDFDNAVAYEEKSVALQPQNSVYRDWLGRAYGAKADREKSFSIARKVKKQFQQAVRLDPSNIMARKDLQEFCMLAPWIVGGNKDEALAEVDAIAKIDPIEGHLARAAFYAESAKKPDLAEKEYREALAARPGKADQYFEAAIFFRERTELVDMNSALDAAAQADPHEPRLAFYRATGMIVAGSDLERGEGYLKSYLASTPDRSDWPSHAGAREWLGRLYEKQGKTAEAAEQYRASLQLEPGRKSAKELLTKLGKSSR
jgi:tetratricopeptide (TPR) repeat protein